MGSIKKEDNGTWTVLYDKPSSEGRGATKKRGFKLRSDAKGFLADIESSIFKGSYVVTKNTLLIEYKNEWLEREYHKNLGPGGKKPKTYLFYKGIFAKRFDDFFIADRLQRITPRRIEDYLRYLKTVTGRHNRPLAPNTTRKHYEALRVLFNYAVRHKDISASPIPDVDSPKKVKTKTKFWDPESIPKALALFKNTEIEWHVRIALLTGLREGEICGLHERFIDFSRGVFETPEQLQYITGEGYLFLTPKTDEALEPLPITPEVELLLRQRITECKKGRLRFGQKYHDENAGRLSTRADGSLIYPQFVYRTFTRILKAQTDIPVIRFHDLRHTCAVWHVAKGTDMKTLQMILRHSDIRATDIYADTTMKLKREAMSRLSFG
jgi:integrase